MKEIIKLPLRQRVMAAASRLFYEEGIRGVGVEAIAKAADTNKMGLYRHFASKDALVVEWVKELIAAYSAVLDTLGERWPDAPRRQLLGFAEFIGDDVARASHRGCPFINAIAELPDEAHPARQLIAAHKLRQLERLGTLCRAAGMAAPETAATHLTLLLEGAQVAAQNRSLPRLREDLLALACLALS